MATGAPVSRPWSIASCSGCVDRSIDAWSVIGKSADRHDLAISPFVSTREHACAWLTARGHARHPLEGGHAWPEHQLEAARPSSLSSTAVACELRTE
eukprot:1237925-Lingulodinium_polyedra.AAC.1